MFANTNTILPILTEFYEVAISMQILQIGQKNIKLFL